MPNETHQEKISHKRMRANIMDEEEEKKSLINEADENDDIEELLVDDESDLNLH